MTHDPLSPYDAVLLASFGGPEKPQDVVPFLENVTAGRGIPRERLEQVGEHYYLFGGRSPINDQNRALLAALREEVSRRGSDVPVAWGNRNWQPFLTDTARQVAGAGASRALVVTTSVYSCYSSCRQYREDMAAAQEAAGGLAVDQIRRSYTLPGFVEANADALVEALTSLQVADPSRAKVLFVTHSIPQAMAESAGPHGGAYVQQHQQVAAQVAQAAGDSVTVPSWELVYCSRSGPPSQPWLEPDVNDRLEELAAAGVEQVVLAPIGFISDHMEVVFDLDTEAAQTCERLGIRMRRAATAGTHPAFVSGLVDRMLERAEQARTGDADLPTPPEPENSPVCRVGCCPNLRGDRPAACQVEVDRGATPH